MISFDWYQVSIRKTPIKVVSIKVTQDKFVTAAIRGITCQLASHVHTNAAEQGERSGGSGFHQETREQMKKAILGIPGTFVLAPAYQQFKVDESRLHALSEEQKESLYRKFLEFDFPEEASMGFPFNTPFPALFLAAEDTDLAFLFDAEKAMMFNRAKQVVHDKVIMPNTVNKNAWICLRQDNNNYSIRRPKTGMYECTCSFFRKNGLVCEHVTAVAEEQNELAQFFKKLKETSAGKVMNKTMPKSSGSKKRKGKGMGNARPLCPDALLIPFEVPEKASKLETLDGSSVKPNYVKITAVPSKNHPGKSNRFTFWLIIGYAWSVIGYVYIVLLHPKITTAIICYGCKSRFQAKDRLVLRFKGMRDVPKLARAVCENKYYHFLPGFRYSRFFLFQLKTGFFQLCQSRPGATTLRGVPCGG